MALGDRDGEDFILYESDDLVWTDSTVMRLVGVGLSIALLSKKL